MRISDAQPGLAGDSGAAFSAGLMTGNTPLAGDLSERCFEGRGGHLAAAFAIVVIGMGRSVVWNVQVDPRHDAPPAEVVHLESGLAIFVRMAGENNVSEFAGGRAPGFGGDLKDVGFVAVEGGNPLCVWIGAGPAFAGEFLVGHVEEVCPVSGQVDAFGRVCGVVAFNAITVEDRLDDAGVAETGQAPFGRLEILR